ncbi:MAG: outer membrane lipoprotein-sorting protein, partial [Gammaproteobacteria bacterium]|nr:outer membrane lipoprotein-sorting protein [Gammaproteobacteria bacterium]
MMRWTVLLIALPIGLLQLSLSVNADEPRARAIMQKVDEREDGDNRVADMEMVLIDREGHERVRRMRQFTKDRDKDTLSLIYFQYPADVRDTGFLTWDYDESEKDDDQWLYLPALGKTKRIAASDKSGSFMGSDLNYSDMIKRELADYDYRLMKEDSVGDQPVWVIEALPRRQDVIEETGYSKSVVFVRQDIHMVVRGISWVADSEELK